MQTDYLLKITEFKLLNQRIVKSVKQNDVAANSDKESSCCSAALVTTILEFIFTNLKIQAVFSDIIWITKANIN